MPEQIESNSRQKNKRQSTQSTNKSSARSKSRGCWSKKGAQIEPVDKAGNPLQASKKAPEKTDFEYRVEISMSGRQDVSWRDKLYLWMHHPDSSRSAKVGSRIRTSVLLLSFLITMLSAWAEFQTSYGPAAPACERAARDYCNIIRNLPADWIYPGQGHHITLDWNPSMLGKTRADVWAANKFCFPQNCTEVNTVGITSPNLIQERTAACNYNGTEVYGGCQGDTNKNCQWPILGADYLYGTGSEAQQIMCPSSTTSTTTLPTVLATTLTPNGNKLSLTESTISTVTQSGPQPFDTSTLGQEIQKNHYMKLFNPYTPVCNRLVCTDLKSNNIQYGWVENLVGAPFGFNKGLLFVTIPIVLFFCVEFILKMMAMRSPRRFFTSVGNWLEFFCVFISLYELLFVAIVFTTGMTGSASNPEGQSALGYESFNSPIFMGYFPSDNFRMWCLIVPIRFLLQSKVSV